MPKQKFFADTHRADGATGGTTQHGTIYSITQPNEGFFTKNSDVDFHITREALDTFIDLAASAAPEIGGLGFGPHDKLGVDVIELDEAGSQRASSVAYANDGPWCNSRQQYYLRSAPIRTVQCAWHTHPGSMGHPSGKAGRALGDMGMFEAFFEQNEWMQNLYCPILTQGRDRDGYMVVNLNAWVCVRDPGATYGFTIGLGKVCVHDDASTFPDADFNPAWEAAVEASKRAVIDAQGVATTDSSKDEQMANYVSRIEGVVSPAFRKKTVLCIGTGGGSYFVEKLARYMPKKLILVDPDVVSISNLSRTNFTFADALNERAKTDALRERVLQVNPFIEVESYSTTLANMSVKQARALVAEADLVVEGTDNFESKKLTNELARKLKKPALFIGVHADAKSGRLIWSYPDVTPCYECAAQERYRAAAQNIAVDLDAQHGSVVDIQLIDMTSLRIALAMLEAGRQSVMGRFFDALKTRGSDITIRTSLESEWGHTVWGALLGDLPTEPKSFAAELQTYLLGIDVTGFPVTRRDSCKCSMIRELYGEKRSSAVAAHTVAIEAA